MITKTSTFFVHVVGWRFSRQRTGPEPVPHGGEVRRAKQTRKKETPQATSKRERGEMQRAEMAPQVVESCVMQRQRGVREVNKPRRLSLMTPQAPRL
jgi:hypothetical protein